MQIACRCGQSFTIGGTAFPHRVGCHMCGKHFLVLNSGETIDIDPTATPVDLTAIQVANALALGRPPVSEICTEETKLYLQNESQAGARAKLEADLRILDLQWNIERGAYSLIPFFKFAVMPSRRLSAILGMVFLGCLALQIAFGIELHDRGWLCPGAFGVSAGVFLPIYVYRRAHEFEKAESEWRRKRAMAIAKSGLDANDIAISAADLRSPFAVDSTPDVPSD
jgi:hypothetical protein